MSELKQIPSVCNIPAGQSFADTLALGVWERANKDPALLSEYTLLLPSRRACRTLREAFLRLSGGKAVLLPRMQPIGDVDADEVSLLLSAEGDVPDIPAAVSKLDRQLLLAHTIMKFKADMNMSFDQAVALSGDLGRFLDEVQTERLGFEALKNLVPEAFASHWQQTLSFLKILTEFWPEILKDRGVIDHALRRNMLLAAQVRAWEVNPPVYPIIAAGSTGTVPAAAELLCLVSRLPQGLVVLPGLDVQLDNGGWDKIGEDHPQYNMKFLLKRLGVEREEVASWRDAPDNVNTDRVRLLSEAMRPAETTEQWRHLLSKDISAPALEGLSRIDCDTPQEEAGVIALLMREVLETKGKTAALITPDRRLARRVMLSLKRWGIEIDDSGGQPLTELSVGTWLMLTAEIAAEALSPVTLLSCLKHPIMAASMPADDLRRMVYLLDQVVLRGPRPSLGFDGLRGAIEALREHRATDKKNLLEWLERIEGLMGEFVTLMTTHGEKPFRELITTHIKMAEALAETLEKKGGARVWNGEAGEAAGTLLNSLLVSSKDIPALSAEHYVSLIGMFLKSVTVRSRYGMHPRLSILGQVEARLYCADMVILGGLNEGTWPAQPAHDPWMSRPMRKQFGLPSPEKSLSLSSHDFVQAATASEVFLTRARKVDGTPTVPARWLLRLETVLQAVGLKWPQDRALQYRKWLKDMDTPDAVVPITRPAPQPPVAVRPRRLSVTQIETWMRDPYQIYAKYVLGLKALDPLDADAGGAERGTFVHAALEEFVKAFPDTLPADAVQQLLSFGKTALTEMRIPQEVEAFWWPRFEKIAAQFVAQEREWRLSAVPAHTEISGLWEFGTETGAFTLTGKADRIDKFIVDGTYAIIDYKSGFTPENNDVRLGLSPQLPLEALMLERGAFEGIPASKVDALVYWKVTGSGQKPVERKTVTPRDTPIEQLIEDAENGLRGLVEKFDQVETPYYSQPRAEAKPKFSDYEHLARVKEWGLTGDGDAEDAA